MNNERCFFIPQVIQSSAMDCGPAALQALLLGFGIDSNFGRLREACHTDVDGTSVDTIEDLALSLGLDATQLLLPVDHLLSRETEALPALLVTRQADGMAHFIVVWRIVADWVQIMDPASGRHWIRLSALQDMSYVHKQAISADEWLDYARSDGFLDALRVRMSRVCADQDWIEICIENAINNEHWSAIACLDAATRMTTVMLATGAIHRGEKAGEILSSITENPNNVPAHYWLIYPAENQVNTLVFRSAVAIHIAGVIDSSTEAKSQSVLYAAQQEHIPQVAKHIFAAMRSDGLLTPSLVSIALLFATIGIVMEVVVFRGLIEISQQLHLVRQQTEASILVFLFLLSLLLIEWPITMAYLGMGRRLELRLRQQLLEKIPKLEDSYFHSRLTSDMMQRAYELRDIRNLPELAINFMRTLLQILLVTIGLAILYPDGIMLIFFSASITMTLAIISQPVLHEQDMQFRTHIGGLSHFYLDALIGLIPIR
ncbi:MAG: cysteine peptidase family C39 domain-containing protein, partial [Mariprofundales bacterium]